MTTDQKLLVPDREAAGMLSMGRSTFWREVKAGKLPQPIKIGGLTRWRVADLQRCVADPASQPTTA
ncbi:helix-turn-helix transcriptional regulator [Variovorax sp. Varisp41]|uniref:helix-turn-helix transcriptional regulator n=1 Tax=Variovorax sp. Varisp41 TaxID=3243033 RepID=UPI0039B61F71